MQEHETPVIRLPESTGSRPARKKKYRARVLYVAPTAARDTFKDEPSCFLGISLENPQFSPAKVESMLEWISRRFDSCTLLVGDSMHRLTLEATRGLSREEATGVAARLGDDFIQSHVATVEKFAPKCRFEFLRCSEVVETASFAMYSQRIRHYFDSHSSFRESVASFGRNYHRKVWDKLSEEERQKRIENSCNYFLEEFAIFCVLREYGTRVFAYPGSFSTLIEVSNGEHEGIEPMLRELIIVSLSLRKR